jgi:hypothetical protein
MAHEQRSGEGLGERYFVAPCRAVVGPEKTANIRGGDDSLHGGQIVVSIFTVMASVCAVPCTLRIDLGFCDTEVADWMGLVLDFGQFGRWHGDVHNAREAMVWFEFVSIMYVWSFLNHSTTSR